MPEDVYVTVEWVKTDGTVTRKKVTVSRTRAHTTKAMYQREVEQKATQAVRSVMGVAR